MAIRGKKCIPGLFCIDNLVLFFLIIALIFFVYLFFRSQRSHILSAIQNTGSPPQSININIMSNGGGGASNGGPLNFDDGTSPQNSLAGVPMAVDIGSMGPSPTRVVGAVPINIETRPNSGYNYSQIGILSSGTGGGDGILPLMGRRLSRDKWQYYTVSNSNMFLKLPVKVRGRSCTSEYGCDEIIEGDSVRVEGYNGDYKATIYENTRFNYLPIAI